MRPRASDRLAGARLGVRYASTAVAAAAPAVAPAAAAGAAALGVPAAAAKPAFDPSLVVHGYPDLSVTTSTMDAGGYVSQWMHAVEWVHATAGLPWWQTVVAVSLALRMATLPFFFKSVSGDAATAAGA
jgi:hypothetical protein